ncbi:MULTISPECIES: NADPH:quinone oxidoreductase family protein [Sphingobium]|uniref:NADPH:quinone oxidoreductase family protein n=1 Tax=Sphingobium TaxID=165695 RepID=UPI00159C63C0|nr:NADPH:quinone oxidoreductase family protein [Sphingobium sp. 15-1]
MKAVLCKEYGPPETLQLTELSSPEPGKGQVVVSVKACGINFPDALIIENKYQFKPDLPFAPGGEISGIIAKVGPGVDGWSVGDEVMAFIIWGGLAEEVVVDAKRLIAKPAGMPYEEAAASLLTYGTVLHALEDRGGLRRGETLLVLGAAGGVGTAAIQVGKAIGARVIAATSSAKKNDYCRSIGADDCIDYANGDLREQLKILTGGEGVDVIFDPVGGALAETALRSTKWNGRYLVVGFASGEIPKIPLNLVLLKGVSVVGVFWGGFLDREPENGRAHAEALAALYATGVARPQLSAVYPLDQASQAISDLRDRRATGKVVVSMQ